jgi:hypothetical protein
MDLNPEKPREARRLEGSMPVRPCTAVDYFNRDPVVHTWTSKLDMAA